MAKNATMAMSNKILSRGHSLLKLLVWKKELKKEKKQSTNYIITLSKLKSEFITQSNIKTEAIFKNN